MKVLFPNSRGVLSRQCSLEVGPGTKHKVTIEELQNITYSYINNETKEQLELPSIQTQTQNS